MSRITQEERDALQLSDEQWDAIYYVATLVQKQNEKWCSEEFWLPVPSLNNLYAVSHLGNVMRIESGQGARPGHQIATHITAKGYRAAKVCVDGKKRTVNVHKIVAEAFLGPCPDGYEVDHIDTDKTNPRLDNLEYVTHEENMRRAKENGLMQSGEARRESAARGWITRKMQDHSDVIWLAIDTEELGEAADAIKREEITPDDGARLRSTRDGMVMMGSFAQRAVEGYFGTTPEAKSRTNAASHEPDLDKEIGQTASVCIDWLASRWRRGL